MGADGSGRDAAKGTDSQAMTGASAADAVAADALRH
jgi:hypothetical protein